jgi:hypothetical protein
VAANEPLRRSSQATNRAASTCVSAAGAGGKDPVPLVLAAAKIWSLSARTVSRLAKQIHGPRRFGELPASEALRVGPRCRHGCSQLSHECRSRLYIQRSLLSVADRCGHVGMLCADCAPASR